MALIDRVFVVIFLFLIAIVAVVIISMQKSGDERFSRVQIGDIVVRVEVADSPREREQGLSNRFSLPQGRGMLFVFPEEGVWSFWMKDTHIPLDIIWADSEGTIVTIARDVQPESYPNTFSSTEPALFVLEVPAGFVAEHSIAEGMQIVVQ